MLCCRNPTANGRACGPPWRAKNEAEFAALKSGYRKGAASPFQSGQQADATLLFDILAESGGEKLVGRGVTFDPDTFWTPEGQAAGHARKSMTAPLATRLAPRLLPKFVSTGYFILSLTVFLVLWQIAALLTNSPALPPPLTVLRTFLEATESGELPYHLAVTLARTAVAFLLSMIISASIGLVMGRSGRLDRFFDSWLILFLNIPALVVIILCYIWFGLTEVAAVLAVSINKIPNVAATMREGARALDRQYMDLARAYRFGGWKDSAPRHTAAAFALLRGLGPFRPGPGLEDRPGR